MSKKITLLFLVILICSAVKAQVYKDPKVPIPLRVKDLLSRMTLEEKIGQMTASDLDKPLNGNIAYGECASPAIHRRQKTGAAAIKIRHPHYPDRRMFARTIGCRCHHFSASH
jgi:hypothetical protein